MRHHNERNQLTSVDNIAFVQVVDGIQHLSNRLRGILLRELSVLANAIEQLTTRGQLRDDVEFILATRQTRPCTGV